MNHLFIAIGAFSAMLSVAAGAFAAHGLKKSLSEEYLAVFQTAANYQMIHSLGLVLIGVIMTSLINNNQETRLTELSGWVMLVGILLFSGSLYALTLTSTKWFGPITPIGGMCLIISWLMLGWNQLSLYLSS